jgi:hypothetical protein
MATQTLTRKRSAKNGMTIYKRDSKRSSGTVYFDKKMFNGDAPETVTITADNLAEPVAEAPKPTPVAEPIDTVNA